jgi:hypothetical protein
MPKVSAINVFQQPLKCDNEEIDCDVAELDQKTKLILHVIFLNHPLYCYLNFVLGGMILDEIMHNLVCRVLYFLTYQSLLLRILQQINLTEGT